MFVELREVNRHNFKRCIELKVADDQTRFVASNVMSLAQAKAFPEMCPLAIYAGDEMVGFLMYGLDPDDGRWWLVRLMVDAAQQGRGYGKDAVVTLLEKLSEEAPDCEELFLSFVPGNDIASNLYLDLGFVDTGRVEEGEIVYRLAIARPS